MIALDREARASLGDQRGGLPWLAEHPPVAELPEATVLVATIDDVVVGFLRMELAPGATAVVERVYVTPEARGLGFGDDLLAAAIDVAQDGQAPAIEAEALPGDRDTKNLYERAGITARKITVHRLLGG